MNLFLWWVGGMIFLFPTLAVCGLWYYRATKPHSRKKDAEQQQLGKKLGIRTETAPNTTPNGKGLRQGIWTHIRPKFWSIFSILIGGAVLLFSLDTKLSPTDVGARSWDYWLQLLIVWGTVASVIALNAVSLGKAAATMQKVLAGVLFALLVALPVWNKVEGTSFPTRQPVREALPQDTSGLPRAWNSDGSITDMSKWPRVQVPAHGDSVQVPSLAGGHIVWGGSGFAIYFVYADGHKCALGDKRPSCGAGDIVAGFARNEGETPLYASYAYARQGEK